MSLTTPQASALGAAPSGTPSTNAGASYNQLRDFSVESQRRMFVQEQERERQAAEFRRASRRILRASDNNGSEHGGAAASPSIMMSGLMKSVDSASGAAAARSKTRVGDDDDDSIADDLSLDSEESFYVGIERADYAQPNNFEMYGADQDAPELTEDRLGIARTKEPLVLNDETPRPNLTANGPSPASLTNGPLDNILTGKISNKPGSPPSADLVVAKPVVAVGITYKGRTNEDEPPTSQVYQQEAAEGKMFINKLVGSSSPAKTPTSLIGHSNPSVSTPAKGPETLTPLTTPRHNITTPAASGKAFPVISPLALLSPFATASNVKSEENSIRQLRERAIRKDISHTAESAFEEKMKEFKQKVIDSLDQVKDSDGKADVEKLNGHLNDIFSLNIGVR